jgi:hypothetical protein
MTFRLLLCVLVVGALSTTSFAQSVAPAKQQPSTGPAAAKQNSPLVQVPSGALDETPGMPSAGSNKGEPDGNAKSVQKYDPQKQCVDADEFATELKSGRNPVGDTIVIGTNFLPTNQRVDVGVRSAFVDRTRYFAGLDRDDGYQDLLARQDVVTRRAVAADTLVKKHLLEADQTIVTLDIDDGDAGLWHKADLYLYTCGTTGSPARVSRASVHLSPYWYSLWLCVATIFVLYLWIAFALRKQDHTLMSFIHSLSPVKVTAGPDGKGSLSKFQILSFTLVVFGLILLFMLQTGVLSDLSGTILTLLGINGIGATVAKGADAQRNTIAPENRAWLLRRNWIPTAKTPVDTSNASWRDFFTTDGEFDVYRYQSFVFALVVIVALVAAGVTQLSTFVIPDTILGIVGLSQAVYIGGKLVTPTNMSDLNTAITDLRDREKKFRDSATTAKQGAVASLQEAIALAGQPAYDAYRDRAKDVAALFALETGNVVSAAALEPSLT